MKTIDITFNNEQEKIAFVNECEADFEQRLDAVSKQAISSGVTTFLLSGPTCAGKTTTANKIIHDFHECGKKVTIISFDDFFKERNDDREVVNEGEKIDYDSVDALDLMLLSDCIKHLRSGNTIKVPIFDFVSQKRKGFIEHKIEDEEIIIFEGIQAVYPEITSLFDTEYKGIFINVNNDVCINGEQFTKNEIRLIRRLVRDRKFRGASPEFTFFLWKTVRENEDMCIFPNMDICEINIDSFMGYELFLMKNYLVEVLAEINKKSKYYEMATKLLNKVSHLDEIDYKYIPKGSLYTEFLGKK